MPMLNVDEEPRILEHSGIRPCEPVVEPTTRLIAPLVQGSIVTAIGEVVIPRTYPGLERRFHFLQHSWNGVAIPVLVAADQERGNLQLLDGMKRRPPEGIIALVFQVVERPGHRIHA